MGDIAYLSPIRDAQKDSMGATPGVVAAQPLQQTSLSFLNSPSENLQEQLFGVFSEGKKADSGCGYSNISLAQKRQAQPSVTPHPTLAAHLAPENLPLPGQSSASLRARI